MSGGLFFDTVPPFQSLNKCVWMIDNRLSASMKWENELHDLINQIFFNDPYCVEQNINMLLK